MTRSAALSFALFACLLLSGCKGKPAPVARKDPTPEEREKNMPGAVRGKGWNIRWATRGENGKPAQPMLAAKSERGEMTYRNNTPSVKLTAVSAQLFRKGVRVADLRAGKLEANREDQTLNGTEGVTLISLQNPRDTTVTAQRITWNMRTSIALAEGDAQIIRRPNSREPIAEAKAPRIRIDMNTGKYEITGENP